MSKDEHNGHHSLMDDMGSFGGTAGEDDYLNGVDVLAKGGGKKDADVDQDSLGQRVRRFRKEKGLSVIDLSQRTGLGEDALKAIEADQASPPLGDLIKLGKALDQRMGSLIASGQERAYTVVRVAERKDISRYPYSRETSYGYSYQSLAPLKKGRSMEPFFVTLRKGDEMVPPSTHDGQEFIFVLSGEMEAVVGEKTEILGPGDCIYYESAEPHLLRPHGDGPTEIVAVLHSGA